MTEKSLYELQQEIFQKRAKILQNIEDESVRDEIASKLNTIRNEMQRVNELLEEVYNSSTSNSPPSAKKSRSRKTLRKRANPEFKSLGIPIPIGQRPGDELVKLGNKIKKNRKSRKNKK